jgi:hypothetical protein
MQPTEDLKKQIETEIEKILKTSFPHCEDGNPNEEAFIKINQSAYECLLNIRQLRVKELV